MDPDAIAGSPPLSVDQCCRHLKSVSCWCKSPSEPVITRTSTLAFTNLLTQPGGLSDLWPIPPSAGRPMCSERPRAGSLPYISGTNLVDIFTTVQPMATSLSINRIVVHFRIITLDECTYMYLSFQVYVPGFLLIFFRS